MSWQTILLDVKGRKQLYLDSGFSKWSGLLPKATNTFLIHH